MTLSTRKGIRTHEGNHVVVVSGLERNHHVGPLSSGVGFPLNHAVSSLLVRITRACTSDPNKYVKFRT